MWITRNSNLTDSVHVSQCNNTTCQWAACVSLMNIMMECSKLKFWVTFGMEEGRIQSIEAPLRGNGTFEGILVSILEERSWMSMSTHWLEVIRARVSCMEGLSEKSPGRTLVMPKMAWKSNESREGYWREEAVAKRAFHSFWLIT